MFIIIVLAVLFLYTVYNMLPDRIQKKIVAWVKDTLKWAVVCGIAIGILYAAIIFLPGALAEDLPDGFYHKVVFIDEIEEQEEELLIHTDDLDHLWDFWEDYPEEDEEFMEYEFDRDLSNIALRFIVNNQILAELDKEERIIRGRIIVLTMWECDPNDPFDEEVVDVYYSEFTTNVEEPEYD